MARAAPDPETALLLDLLSEAFERKSWHGTNLRGSFRGVSAAEAAWRPDEGRPNARELALHLVRDVAAPDLFHAGQVQLVKWLRPRE